MQKKQHALAVLIAGLFAGTSAFAQQSADNTDVGTISITGEGDKLGTGQMIQEETPKARSTVTRAAMEKMRPTANPFQALNLLPGVNMNSQDATGVFGGSLRVRGFNSDQMGFTIDGAPVNDSGSFSVFPQEYTDIENTCEIFITQGSADNDAPHVGATGGNIGIVTCDPLAVRTVKGSITGGDLHLSRVFVRFDTGKLDVANGWSSFLSYSNTEVYKFKGLGRADRDHVDFKTVLELPAGSRLSLTALYNQAVTNNIRTGTKAQFDTDPNFDFASTFVGNPAPGPGKQTPATQDTFYKLSLNPFRNAVVTAKANLNLTPTMRLDIEPYYWYGYGTGGNEQFTLNEGGTFRGGVADVNGDGDRLDSVIIYRGSVTDTNRPGATVKLNWVLANHRVMAGYWYERARHRQTGPGTTVDSAGNPADLWLQSHLVLRADGTPFQLRDWLTISRAGSAFISDTMGFLNDKLVVQAGVKQPFIARAFQNFANEGTGQGADYSANKRFDEVLPSLGVKYQLTDEHQVFANIAKNFKAPGNFVYQAAIINGINRVDAINAQLKAETSVNTDLGYRYYGKQFTFSGSLYAVDFKNRLARQFLPDQGVTLDTNVGDSTIRGFELETGTVPVHGVSGYLSVSYTKSKLKDDLVVSATNIQPTAGKDFVDTPPWMVGAALQYAQGPLFANVQVKYTGKRFSTLVNDESVGGYTLTDINAGYNVAGMGFRKVSLRANVSNVFDRRFLLLNAGSGSLFTTNATGPGAFAPAYYQGAPRFSSVSLSVEF
jgi:iron complex outermembrane receptor protein